MASQRYQARVERREAILDTLKEKGPATRATIVERFRDKHLLWSESTIEAGLRVLKKTGAIFSQPDNNKHMMYFLKDRDDPQEAYND